MTAVADAPAFNNTDWGMDTGVSVSGGAATIPVTGNGDASGIISNVIYGLVGSGLSVKLDGGFGNGSKEFYFGVTSNHDTNPFDWPNSVGFYLEGGYLSGYYMIGGTETASKGASITLPVWMQLYEDSGQIHLEYSEDGLVWVSLWTVADPLPDPTAVYIAAAADYYGTETASNAVFSHLNEAEHTALNDGVVETGTGVDYPLEYWNGTALAQALEIDD